ncbi:MAG: hypothetical protein RLZZ22_892 [Pseudomonadota bacterium]
MTKGIGEFIGYEMILAIIIASQDKFKSEALSAASESLLDARILDSIEFLEEEQKQEVLDAAKNAVERVGKLSAAIRFAVEQQDPA